MEFACRTHRRESDTKQSNIDVTNDRTRSSETKEAIPMSSGELTLTTPKETETHLQPVGSREGNGVDTSILLSFSSPLTNSDSNSVTVEPCRRSTVAVDLFVCSEQTYELAESSGSTEYRGVIGLESTSYPVWVAVDVW